MKPYRIREGGLFRLAPAFGVMLLMFMASVRAPGADDSSPPDPSSKSAVDIKLPDEGENLLRRAGNAATDEERLSLLRELEKRSDLPEAFRHDLERMIQYVNLCVDNYEISKHSDKYLVNPTMHGKTLLKFAPERTRSLLNPMVTMYRARTKVHDLIQQWTGKVSPLGPEERKAFIADRIKLSRDAAKAFRDNPILKMYCGNPIPWPQELSVKEDPHAPEWANLQHEGLEKLRQVAIWWIRNRQKPEGFFGTGWGDDVEMWRVLVPLTVAFHDPELADSQRMLSEGVFSQPYMAKGFTDQMTDVEHSSEDFTDTVTSMLYMAPGEQIWADRALRVLDLAKNQWTGINARGQLQFKATNFNVDKVDGDPKQACDTFFHVRVVQPSLILWQRTGDPAVGDFVTRWMNTWVDTSMREEHGKPAGIIPTVIHWPDGTAGGVSPEWWKPGNFRTPLYDWPGGGNLSMIPNTMLLTYLMTDNVRYLGPIVAMADLQREAGKLGDAFQEGTRAWAASQLNMFLPVILAKYRLATGDTRFDDLLAGNGSGYVKMRLTGNRDALIKDLKQNADAFRVNFPVYTSECRAGDRVIVGPSRYFSLGEQPHPMPLPLVSALYAAATGNPDMTMYCPTNAVRWWTPPTDIAALVTGADRVSFAAELYHFGDKPREMEAELLLLRAGSYSVALHTLNPDGEKELFSKTLVVDKDHARVKFQLPPRQLCSLKVDRIK